LDAAFGEQLRQVGIGETIPQIPPHCQRDHIRREAVADEGVGAVCGAAALAATTAIHQPSLSIMTVLGDLLASAPLARHVSILSAAASSIPDPSSSQRNQRGPTQQLSDYRGRM
jgi:hypothetical protein